jgi:hypothetical protein
MSSEPGMGLEALNLVALEVLNSRWLLNHGVVAHALAGNAGSWENWEL